MISNANTKTLGEIGSGLPDVSEVVNSFLQPLTIDILQKTTVAGMTQEKSIKTIRTMGARQPLSAEQISIKPEGQRSWKWEMLHFTPEVNLRNDDRIMFQNIPFRIMEQFDWSEYGFRLYHAKQDYKNLSKI